MSENTIFSYTKRDYETSRKEGISKIPTISEGMWSDLNSTDPGIIILDYVHALVDMINYYQDHQALETFLPTAKERVNIFRIAKQLCYSIRSAKGATVIVKFISPLLYDHIIKIPKGTKVLTETGIPYITDEDAYLQAGKGDISIVCSQGEYFEDTYKGTGISQYSNVQGATNQTYLLNSSTIDIDTITITDDTGYEWKQVDYIVFTTENEKAYQVDLNPNNTITIRFGNGKRGYVPATTDELTIRYKVTMADQGRIAARSIVLLDGRIADGDDYAEFKVTNEEASNGGYIAESSSDIKEKAPGVIKSQGRAVTLIDFESLAESVEGVLNAKAYDRNTLDDLFSYEVLVLITPEPSYSSSTILVEKVTKFLEQRMIPPTILQVITPTVKPIDIAVEVKKIGDISSETLKYNIQEAIIKYFDDRYGEIGEDFYPADLSAVISRLEDVKYVASITPNEQVLVEDRAVARLGNITSITVN